MQFQKVTIVVFWKLEGREVKLEMGREFISLLKLVQQYSWEVMHTTKGTEKKKCRIVYLMALCGQLNIGRKVMKHAGLDGWKKWFLGIYYVLSTVLTVLHITHQHLGNRVRALISRLHTPILSEASVIFPLPHWGSPAPDKFISFCVLLLLIHSLWKMPPCIPLVQTFLSLHGPFQILLPHWNLVPIVSF